MRALILCAIVACTTVFGWSSKGSAQNGSSTLPESDAKEIFQTVLSPYCPGRALNDCPSTQAHNLKHRIRSQLAAGKTKETVLQELYAEFGNSIRAIPEYSGFGLVAWLMPFLFLVIGGLVLTIWLRQRRPVSAPSSTASESLSPEMQARIQREMEGSDE